jgi:hypothetical protein
MSMGLTRWVPSLLASWRLEFKMNAHYEKYKKTFLECSRRQRKGLRDKVLDHYGAVCTCCGETERAFLTVDHIKNDGSKHRKEIHCNNGSTLYSWLVKNNFPDGFQILCRNCNWAKFTLGKCPHKKRGAKPVELKS